MWDASEYIAAAYTLGLPHPPGNPFFVLLGRVFSILPIAPNVAMRVNVIAALSSAIAAAIWFIIADRVASRMFEAVWQRRLVGFAAALTGGTAFTVWHQSVVNEKVYTLALAGIAIISWLVMRWLDERDAARQDRYLILIAYLLGLGYANHMAGILPLPAIGLAVLMVRPAMLLRWKLILTCAGALILGGTPFLTQPIRAAYSPAINEGEPTACRQGPELGCTFSKGTWEAFKYNFNREQYGKPALSERQAPFTAQVGMWWLYFRWQWLRDVHLEHQTVQSAAAALFLLLGLTGAMAHYRHDRASFWYFGSLMFLMTLCLVYYLNFRYGASQGAVEPVPREVRDRDYFYLWGYSAWGVWAALGMATVFKTMQELSERLAPGGRRLVARSTVAALAVLALLPLKANWASVTRREDVTTIAFARDLLNSVEPYGVLVTGGDNDTFPLWYAQEVEGIRKDVTVAVLSLMNTDWYARGIIRRPIHQYDSARGPAVYRNRSWPVPRTPPLNLTIAQADSIPPYLVVNQPLQFRHDSLDVVIEPRALLQVQGGGLLERSDLLVLQMIADSWPERPIYFSRTTANYAERLGFGEYTLAQGLARKLVTNPRAEAPDAILIEGSGWLDIKRSRELWEKEMVGQEAILRRGDWVDRPSLSIPFSYLLAGSELAEALGVRGDLDSSARVMDTVNRVARAVRIAPAIDVADPPPPIGTDR